jgi:hypothetical protein
VIRCKLHHLEQRCRERGYTLEQVRACIVSEGGDGIMVDETHPAYPKKMLAVGDVVASLPASVRAPPAGGPGTELKGMLRRWLGIQATPTCPCNAHAVQMDLWGPDECERRLDEIVGWLEEEAKRRGLPFVRAAARQMVLAAVRRARNAAAK